MIQPINLAGVQVINLGCRRCIRSWHLFWRKTYVTTWAARERVAFAWPINNSEWGCHRNVPPTDGDHLRMMKIAYLLVSRFAKKKHADDDLISNLTQQREYHKGICMNMQHGFATSDLKSLGRRLHGSWRHLPQMLSSKLPWCHGQLTPTERCRTVP